MLNKKTASFAAVLALLLAAGCGSMGDVLGGGSPNSNVPSNVRGTIDSVDLNNHSIWLTNTNTSLASGSNGGSIQVFYDDRTSVSYQNRTYRPEDLERGDQVDIRVTQSGNRLVADSMTVTYNAAQTSSYPSGTYPSGSGTSTYPSGGYNTTVSGTIRNVDASRRTIEIDHGYNAATSVVEYNTNTPVSFNGRSYQPADLERGDQVDIRATDLGGGRIVAQNITVVRSVSGTNGSNGTYGGTTSSNYSTVRGTVRYVDTSRRTIELEQTTWTNGFLPGTNNTNTVIVQYDVNASVYVSGQAQPISGLERGDVIDVQVENLGSANLLARSITLVRDVRR
jgi:hypothetical protein